MNKKIIITAALVGNATTKEKAPTVPYSAKEIAREAVICAKAGAAIIHIHVRTPEGRPTMDTETFVNAYTASRNALKDAGLDAILNLSTGGDGSDELRTAHIERIQPEMCSYNPGSINWGDSVYLNPPSLMKRLGLICQKTHTKPEIEIFDTAMLNNVRDCCKKGILTAPCHFQFIMGIPGGMDGTLKNISFLLDNMPQGSTWSITGIGRSHIPMMLAGLSAGADGIRVGLEDNIWMHKGIPATNESLVKRAVQLSAICGREAATAEEAREILHIKSVS